MIKWIKQYGWYFAISILGGTLGAVFSLFIWHQGNLGTIAEWVSGLGSLGAIVFAYWQMHVQRKQYEKDKILANRPFFSFIELFYLEEGKDYLWMINEDFDLGKMPNIFKKINEGRIDFENDIYAYRFKNVSRAVATNVVLKVEYQNKVNNKILKTDYCNIETCVVENEQVIMLPHSIMNEKSIYARCPKKIYLYFTTVDDRAYCQRWIEKIDKSVRIYAEPVDIKEVPIEEMPNEGASSCFGL